MVYARNFRKTVVYRSHLPLKDWPCARPEMDQDGALPGYVLIIQTTTDWHVYPGNFGKTCRDYLRCLIGKQEESSV